MSQTKYNVMKRLLQQIDQPVGDAPEVERLRQAVHTKDASAAASAVRDCLDGDVLPEGFICRLLQQHGLDQQISVEASDAQATPRKPSQPCQGCGGAKYNPQDFNRPGGPDELIQQLG